MSFNTKTESWPLVTALDPNVVADAVIAAEDDRVAIGFDTNNPNTLGSAEVKPHAVVKGERLGQFTVYGVTVPPVYDAVVHVDPFSEDGSYGVVELTQRQAEQADIDRAPELV